MKISELDEADLKVQTENMYRAGGIENVLACVSTMYACQIVIMRKLNEIILNEKRDRAE